MTDFEEVFRRYYKPVYLYALGLSGSESMAEEITADTFFKALKAIKNFDGRCDIRVWLCQIAKNDFYNRCKKNKRLADLEQINEKAADGFILEEKFEDKTEAMRIHRLLHDLEEPYKEVFTLRVFGELPFKKIGEIFGKTESWARVTYHRGRLRLMNRMEGKDE